MIVAEADKTTYILLSGIDVPAAISINDNVELQPADCSHLDLDTALKSCANPDDIPVVTAFIPRTRAQIKISGDTPKELAVLSWNTLWDAILLSAFLHTEIGFNLQSNVPGNEISSDSILRATNYHMRGFTNHPAHVLSEEDSLWLSEHFSNGRKLLENDKFKTAVHSLATYRWHSMPRIQMAILWAGIEGLFGASSEIRFRISLYIARFLYPNNKEECQNLFSVIKTLYNSRSAAVHGSKVKGDINQSVNDSAMILQRLIKQCAIDKSVPDENKLVP
jgi:hypothetical protein